MTGVVQDLPEISESGFTDILSRNPTYRHFPSYAASATSQAEVDEEGVVLRSRAVEQQRPSVVAGCRSSVVSLSSEADIGRGSVGLAEGLYSNCLKVANFGEFVPIRPCSVELDLCVKV